MDEGLTAPKIRSLFVSVGKYNGEDFEMISELLGASLKPEELTKIDDFEMYVYGGKNGDWVLVRETVITLKRIRVQYILYVFENGEWIYRRFPVERVEEKGINKGCVIE